jgi:hypothetical protein
VLALDDQVQRGLVRGQAAAICASDVSPVMCDRYFASNLLRCVLQARKHSITDCKCVETVLAWGCCPTQVMVCPIRMREVSVMSTALHEVRTAGGDRKDQWIRALCSTGSTPCSWYNYAVTSSGLAALDPWHASVFAAGGYTGQWHRWHRRRHKRQWFAAMVL